MNTYADLTKKEKIALELFYILGLLGDDVNINKDGHEEFTMINKDIYNIHTQMNARVLDNDSLVFPRFGTILEKEGFLDRVKNTANKNIKAYKINDYGTNQIIEYVIPFEETNKILPFVENELKLLEEFEDELLEADGIEMKLDNKIGSIRKKLISTKNLCLTDKAVGEASLKPSVYCEIKHIAAAPLIKEHREKVEASRNYYISLKDEIIEQASKKGGFITFKNHITKEEIKVPKIPFLIWSINSNHHSTTPDRVYDLKHELLAQWEPLAGNNIKLQNDCEFHNDWIIGAGFNAREFYSLMDNSYNWFSYMTMNFYMEYVLNDNFDYKKEHTLESEDDIISNDDFKVYKALPKAINKDITFPFYFKPFYQADCSNFNIKDIKGFISAIAIKDYDESIIEIGLELSKNPYNLVLTNNGTKAAHIINVAKEIKLNILEVDCDVSKFKHNEIYEISEQEGFFNIRMISSSKSSTTRNNIPLQDLERISSYVECSVSSKAANIAKLYTSCFNVPPAFCQVEIEKSSSIFSDKLIARSCGSNEGDVNASFSGIFKSIRLKENSYQTAIKDVVDSFTSSAAKKYAKALNVPLPKAGILFQEFKEASLSCVANSDIGKINFEYLHGACEGIVSGSKEVMSISLNQSSEKEKSTPVEIYELRDIVNKIKKILGFQFIEVEAVHNNNKWWILQVLQKEIEHNERELELNNNISSLDEAKKLLITLGSKTNISSEFTDSVNNFIELEIIKERNKLEGALLLCKC